ncbi:MAG: S24/S26 family peptidase [Brevefilum sp.]|nr:S24/S26 family peptidase [Brevefilum sp.]
MTDLTTSSATEHIKPVDATTRIPCTSAAFTELSAEVLRSGWSIRFRAHGKSMTPLLRDGDLLLVQPVEHGSLRPGEIVLCSLSPSHVVVHRIIRHARQSDGDRFLVQGDQASTPDGWFNSDQIFGRLVEIERDGRRIQMVTLHIRFLDQIAVWRLRLGFTRFWVTRTAGVALKRLPCFGRFFS